MDGARWPLFALVLLVVAAAAGYFISEVVPIFILAVFGLPIGAWLLNRSPRDTSDTQV